MPEPIVPKEGDEPKDGKQDNNVEVDAFGSPNTQPEADVDNGGEEGGEGDKGDKGGKDKGGKDDKKFEAIPEDHPTILALKKQIEDVKNEYGGNLAGQRDVIKKLEGKIEALTGGKGGKSGEGDTSHLPFDPKEIVFSKDLPKDKLDDMTENEIKLHDEVMKNREVMNKQAQERYDEKQQAQKDSEAKENQKVEDLNTSVRTIAKDLANGDEALANQIIEKSKKFNLSGLNEKELKETIEEAYKLLPTYKPPKEQTVQKKGGAVKTGGQGNDDPFGTSKIVEEVASKQSGKSFDL